MTAHRPRFSSRWHIIHHEMHHARSGESTTNPSLRLPGKRWSWRKGEASWSMASRLWLPWVLRRHNVDPEERVRLSIWFRLVVRRDEERGSCQGRRKLMPPRSVLSFSYRGVLLYFCCFYEHCSSTCLRPAWSGAWEITGGPGPPTLYCIGRLPTFFLPSRLSNSWSHTFHICSDQHS